MFQCRFLSRLITFACNARGTLPEPSSHALPPEAGSWRFLRSISNRALPEDSKTLEVAIDDAPVVRHDAAFQRRRNQRLSFCAGGFCKQAARRLADVSSLTSRGWMRLAPATTLKNWQDSRASRRTL